MSESIDFILSAKDQASAVFRKTKEELQLLSHHVNATSKQAKTGFDAIAQFGNALGADWISDSVRQFQMLNDSIGKSSELMSKSGGSALAMKAGIYGMVIYGSVAVGKMLLDWVYETKKWESEFQASIEKSRKLIGDLGDATAKNLKTRLSDIKEFGGSKEEQQEQARAMRDQLELDIRATRERKKNAEERLKAQQAEWGQFARGTAQRIEETKLQIETDKALLEAREQTYEELNEFLREDPRKALRATQQQTDVFKDQKAKLEEELEFAKLTKEEIELAKIAKLGLKKEQIAELQILVKQRQEYEAQRKEKEKQLQEEIKLSEKLTRELESELDKAITKKIDLSIPTLTGSDSRLLTQASGVPNFEERQLQVTQKQLAIAEAQKKLDIQIEAHLRLLAEAARETGGGLEL